MRKCCCETEQEVKLHEYFTEKKNGSMVLMVCLYPSRIDMDDYTAVFL